jgi:Ca2+-binding EF-hand superfamily protein
MARLAKISGDKRTGSVEKQLFLQLFSSGPCVLPGLYAERLFQCFDKDGNGQIELKEFLLWASSYVPWYTRGKSTLYFQHLRHER